MNDIGTLVTVGLAFWLVAISPGPANLSNAMIAMRYGRKASLLYSTGLTTTLVSWGILAATGMGAVLQASLSVLIAFKIFGAAYLFWLAWQSARSAMGSQPVAIAKIPNGNWYLRGFILNLSNPKCVIAWMAALSVGLDPSGSAASVVPAMLVCVFVAVTNNVFYSLVFSTGGMMLAYERSRRWIEGAVAGLFAGAGLGILKSAFSK